MSDLTGAASRFWGPALRWVMTLTALFLAFLGGAGAVVGLFGIRHVMITDAPRTYEPSAGISESIFFSLVAALVFLLLCRPRSSDRIDSIAVFGACWVVFWWAMMAFFLASAVFTGSQPPCTYKGCWPYLWQNILTGVPLVLGAATVVFTALRWHDRPYLWRALPGPLVFLVLTVVWALLWDRIALPFLQSPPPF